MRTISTATPRHPRRWSLALGLVTTCGFLSAPAPAALTTTTINSGTLNLAIPDHTYNGSLGSMTSSAITLPAHTGTITDVNVIVTMAHQHISDLTIKLMGPGSATPITLLNRPGLTLFAPHYDDGTGSGGADAGLANLYPITYDDQAPSTVSSKNMGSGLTAGQVVGDPGNTSPNNYRPNAAGATPGTLANFNNLTLPASTTWTLYVADSNGINYTGTLNAWSLTVVTSEIPEPATMTLLTSFAALALLRRQPQRRRIGL